MVAYNFQQQFAPAVKSGEKLQTIRALGKRRHAKSGDYLQLYTGMRTKSCRKLLDSICISSEPIGISGDMQVFVGGAGETIKILPIEEVEKLAIADGFDSAEAFFTFFGRMHGLPFLGVLIKWKFPNSAAEHRNASAPDPPQYAIASPQLP